MVDLLQCRLHVSTAAPLLMAFLSVNDLTTGKQVKTYFCGALNEALFSFKGEIAYKIELPNTLLGSGYVCRH